MDLPRHSVDIFILPYETPSTWVAVPGVTARPPWGRKADSIFGDACHGVCDRFTLVRSSRPRGDRSVAMGAAYPCGEGPVPGGKDHAILDRALLAEIVAQELDSDMPTMCRAGYFLKSRLVIITCRDWITHVMQSFIVG